jgi:hypothetical protein
MVCVYEIVPPAFLSGLAVPDSLGKTKGSEFTLGKTFVLPQKPSSSKNRKVPLATQV